MRDIRKDLQKRMDFLREEQKYLQSRVKKLDEEVGMLKDLLEQEEKRWETKEER